MVFASVGGIRAGLVLTNKVRTFVRKEVAIIYLHVGGISHRTCLPHATFKLDQP
jgi:hypothetical protein